MYGHEVARRRQPRGTGVSHFRASSPPAYTSPEPPQARVQVLDWLHIQASQAARSPRREEGSHSPEEGPRANRPWVRASEPSSTLFGKQRPLESLESLRPCSQTIQSRINQRRYKQGSSDRLAETAQHEPNSTEGKQARPGARLQHRLPGSSVCPVPFGLPV